MYPPPQPNHLNVPLPDASALAPPDKVSQAMNLIAPLFALGTSLGGSPNAGMSLLAGFQHTQEIHRRDAEVQAHQAQQDAIAQQHLQLQAQQAAAAEEAKRQAAIESLMKSTYASVQGKSKDEYEQAIAFAENIGQQFYGLAPNKIRATVPYRAPDAGKNLYAALDKYFKNPANKNAIDSGAAMQAAISVDTDGDGIPDKPVPIAEAIQLSGYPIFIDPETQKPISTGKPIKPENVQDFDLVYQGLVDKWTTDKGRKPTDQERGQLALQARKQVKDASTAPPMTINFGASGTPQQQLDTAVEAILSHRMAPSQAASMFGGFGKEGQAFKRALTAEVNRRDPSFNWQEAESNYVFGKATGTQNTVRFLDNIKKTLPRLRAASSDLKRGGVQLINKGLLASKRQFGNTQVATFDTDRLILADEIAKVLQGGGTGSGTSDAKLRQASDLLRGEMSMGQFDATLNEVEELLVTRRGTLTKGTYMEQPAGADAGVEVWVRDAQGRLVKKPKGGG